MRKICLVFLASESFDALAVFEQAFREIGFEVEAIRIPHFRLSSLNRKALNKIEMLLNEKSKGQYLIFSPQSTELFLKGANLTLLYSAYRSWFDHGRMRVIPHPWTPVRPPESINDIKWTNKPPLRIGFMGRDYLNSRIAKVILKSPMQLKQWFLRGSYLRYARAVALINEVGLSAGSINTFPRIETMRSLKANRYRFADVQLDIVEKQSFGGSGEELKEYTDHLERNTYIVCPRGTENYSYRIYETLGRGRIPVIIDTDVVLPKEIDWDRLSIRVPYESLESIYDVILRDYNSRSGAEFVARQEHAFATMSELRTMRWVKDLANELGHVIENVV